MRLLIIYLADSSRAKLKSVNCGFCLMLLSVQFTSSTPASKPKFMRSDHAAASGSGDVFTTRNQTT